jgi:hypothetical protein
MYPMPADIKKIVEKATITVGCRALPVCRYFIRNETTMLTIISPK